MRCTVVQRLGLHLTIIVTPEATQPTDTLGGYETYSIQFDIDYPVVDIGLLLLISIP